MKRKIRQFPYVLSAAVLIAFLSVSAIIGWSTENTVWGMFGFLFYVLIFVLGVWILDSILICLFALINGLPLK